MNDLFGKPTENWDAVKNCKIIYQPKGQAEEYAKLATNPYIGCGHRCAYCYVPERVNRNVTRREFDANATPRKGYIAKLRRDAKKYFEAGISERVLLSFTTDVFNPLDTSLTRKTIETLREFGLSFTTLSKGGGRALQYLDLYRPGRDHYACTLTTLDDAESLRWERGAALPQDRIDTLKAFDRAGIYTWVSLEPTLNAQTARQIVARTHEFVDLYKVGKLNYVNSKVDWSQYTKSMAVLSRKLDAKMYFKKDLQPYLPDWFENWSAK